MEVYPLVNIEKAILKPWPSRNSGFTDLPSYKRVDRSKAMVVCQWVFIQVFLVNFNVHHYSDAKFA